jgi:hypothetical protein
VSKLPARRSMLPASAARLWGAAAAAAATGGDSNCIPVSVFGSRSPAAAAAELAADTEFDGCAAGEQPFLTHTSSSSSSSVRGSDHWRAQLCSRGRTWPALVCVPCSSSYSSSVRSSNH